MLLCSSLPPSLPASLPLGFSFICAFQPLPPVQRKCACVGVLLVGVAWVGCWLVLRVREDHYVHVAGRPTPGSNRGRNALTFARRRILKIQPEVGKYKSFDFENRERGLS